MPYEDLSESARHALLPRENKQLFWLSWSMIYSEVCKRSQSGMVQDQCILSDLKLLLEKKGLNSFTGLSGIKKFHRIIGYIVVIAQKICGMVYLQQYIAIGNMVEGEKNRWILGKF